MLVTPRAKLPTGSSDAPPRPARRRGEVRVHVLTQLRRGLMTGSFMPGQVVSLRKLATHLGTSPMPVRAALAELVAARALEELPNRSVRVPRLSEARLAELFAVRGVIEGMAAKEACRRATPQFVTQLDRVNKRLVQAIARRDLQGCLALNQEFHFTLYEAAQSEVLMPLIESLWLQSGPTMYFSLQAPDMPWSAANHAEILAGLRAGNPVAVQRAVSHDVRATARQLLQGAYVSRPGKRQGPAIGMDVAF